jgi:hypothetical protein
MGDMTGYRHGAGDAGSPPAACLPKASPLMALRPAWRHGVRKARLAAEHSAYIPRRPVVAASNRRFPRKPTQRQWPGRGPGGQPTAHAS